LSFLLLASDCTLYCASFAILTGEIEWSRRNGFGFYPVTDMDFVFDRSHLCQISHQDHQQKLHGMACFLYAISFRLHVVSCFLPSWQRKWSGLAAMVLAVALWLTWILTLIGPIIFAKLLPKIINKNYTAWLLFMPLASDSTLYKGQFPASQSRSRAKTTNYHLAMVLAIGCK
jgi:hypothetical protein